MYKLAIMMMFDAGDADDGDSIDNVYYISLFLRPVILHSLRCY